MAKWLELMRTGKFKDRHGIERDITQNTIDTIAGNYKTPGSAPVIVGHPGKEKFPAFGVVDALKVVGDRLLYLPGKIVPEFAALVRKGGFPDVSAGLTTAMDQLTHVSFLSAEMPAIEGLTPVCEFSAASGSENDIAIAVSDIVKEDLPEFAASEALGLAETKLAELTTATASLNVKLAEFSSSAAALTQENTQVKALKAQLATQVDTFKKQLRAAEFSAFVEDLVIQGRVLPDQKTSTVAMLETMHQATPVEFSSADGKQSPIEQYKSELKNRPVIVTPGEERNPEFSSGSANLSAVEVGRKARQYIDEQAAKGISVDVITAVNHVNNK